MRRLAVALALSLSVLACGDDDVTPTNPGPPPRPNYTGIWNGTYTITACTQNGTIAIANLCGSLGNTAPFQLNIGQHATTHIAQGTFTLGTIPFTIVPAPVNATGTLTFSGTSLSNGISVLATWTLTSPIVGSLTQVWSSAALSGQVNLTGAINVGVVKVGQLETPPAPAWEALTDLPRALGAR